MRISLFFFLVFFCFFTDNIFAQTIINRGDLAIVAVNANLPAPNSSKDEISFVCFKDITNGTELQLIDAGYENCVPGMWSGGQEGGAILKRTGGTIPAGTVITFRTTSPFVFTSPDNAWSVSDLYVHPTNNNYSLLAANFNINSTGDQIYMVQGGTWTPSASLCTINGTRTSPNATFPGNGGRLLFGFSTSATTANPSGWSPFQQSSGESGLFPGLECFSMAPTSGTAYNKYIGPLTPATQTAWIARISNVSNWKSYGSSATYTASGTNFSAGFVMSVLPGGGIPTATWSTPPPQCSNGTSIDLSTYVTGTSGGTFSGTGVSGNMFNPSGLNGNYDITYSVVYLSCPITQTNTITVNTAPTPPALSVTPPSCTVATGSVSVTGSTTGLTFSNDGATYTNTTGLFSGIAAGATYSITTKSSAGCFSTATTGTMPAQPTVPAQPTITITPPDCTTATGTVTVTSATAGLTFSNDGINYTNTTGIFSGIPGGGGYSITAKNGGGCTSTAVTGTMAAAPTPQAQPALSVTPPTCTTPTGSVNVTSSTTGLTFSSDGTNYTNTTGIFTGITAGAGYSITAKNGAGCTSTAATGTMPAAPGSPAPPTLNVTPPTCTTPTGSVNVTSSTTGLTFSSDGTNYTNTTGIFTGIAAGAGYSITAKNGAGCTSTAATGTMPVAPGAPAQPTVTTTPPDCTTATGTVTVTSATTGLTFSSDGTNYTNTTGIFSGIAGGANYSITAKNGTGCTSTAATGTMATAPAKPTQPAISVTPPTCTTATGTVTVTSATTGLTFSSNGTNYTNTTGIFSGIAGGANYSITAKNGTGCTSTGATGTMAVQPAAPSMPTINVNPPTCTTATGSVNVTSSTTGLTFSSDGTNYTNTTGIFSGIAGGAGYSITAKNSAGCTSAAATGTMAVQPAAPSMPTINVTPPTCTTATGSVNITSSTTGLTFSSDGTNYTNTTGIFSGIAGGANYSITAKNGAGCTSAAATGTMPAQPVAPSMPTINVTPPTCTTATGSVNVTSSTTGLTFSSDGTNYTNTTGIFSGIAAGAGYSITTKNTAGCISTPATGTMPVQPVAPSIPTINVTPPTCTTATGSVNVTSSTTGLTFSSDGTNYTNTTGIFPGIAAGAGYSITAKNSAGCTSTAVTGTMPAGPTVPLQPTVTATPPTCTTSTGTVTVTSTLTGLTFSNDGTTYTNTTGIFSGIAGGANYSITAKNAAGCISTPATGIMALTPATPSQPIINITPPTCTVNTASIKVTSTLTGLTFSNDGASYTNSTGIFSGIAAEANYSITAKNTAGCVSVAANGTIPAIPSPLPAPVLSVTNYCGSSTITATGVTGTLTWSDGGTGSTRVVNTAIGPITATQSASGCTSAVSNAVSAAPSQPLFPTLGNDAFLCPGESLVLNPGTYDSYTWQDNSSSPKYTVTQSGIYKVVVKNNNSSCTGTDSIRVTYFIECTDIYFPTAFTPDGDGKNDKFGPVGNLNNVTGYTLSVFNRYGELVFKSNNPFDKWDATYLGKISATGNYVWRANFLYNGKARVQQGNLVIIK